MPSLCKCLPSSHKGSRVRYCLDVMIQYRDMQAGAACPTTANHHLVKGRNDSKRSIDGYVPRIWIHRKEEDSRREPDEVQVRKVCIAHSVLLVKIHVSMILGL